jgi:hypothetical protein
MSDRTSTETGLRLVVVAPAPNGPLAADLVAAHLGIDRDEAGARLAEPGAILGDGADPAALHRLAPLLRLFGLRVRLESGPATAEPRFDVALQAAGPEVAPRLAAAVGAFAGLAAAAAAQALAAPCGLLLTGLDWAAVGALRRLPGLRLAVSDPEAATYDLFPSADPDAAGAPELARCLRRLGLGPCPLSGALAAQLDRRLKDHLTARLAGLPVVAVNRDFQRFDLVLAEMPAAMDGALRGFIAGRAARAGLAAPAAAGAPPCLERGLDRADALCFHADYAAIGIAVRLRLCVPLQPAAP